MKTAQLAQRPALDLLEEAMSLLRTAPIRITMLYFVGTAPFVLAFLAFWADMSANAFARERLPWFSCLMAFLYLWMKSWQAAFVIELRRNLTGTGDRFWSFGRIIRLVTSQCLIQSLGLLIDPLAFVLMAPFGWTFAFFQSVSGLEVEGSGGIGNLIRKGNRLCGHWAGQNHAMLVLLGIFAGVVFINFAVAFFFLPQIIKTFTGIDLLFTRSAAAAMNTTFLTVCAGATYLCLDPLIKAAYCIRNFYIDAVPSGEDLRLELSHLAAARKLVALIALVIVLGGGVRAQAQTETKPSAHSLTVDEQTLRDSLERTSKRDEFAWRLPKLESEKEEAKRGIVAQFLIDVGRWIGHMVGEIWDWARKLIEKMPRSERSAPDSSGGGLQGLPYLLVVVLLILAAATGVWAWRALRGVRRMNVAEVRPVPARPAPDLLDESVMPTRLPSDEWIQLAQELMANGELRLAMRAYYLASLAHFSTREIIRVAMFKSNNDYLSEVQRRLRSTPEFIGIFRENVRDFDRVWYGRHPVDLEFLGRFETGTRRLCGL